MPDDAPHAAYTLIRDLPATERPRERLRDYGSNSLSVAELLAILLRTGSAKESALSQAARLLKDFDGLPGLARTSFADLCAQPGLGEAKAAQLMAALELGVRCAESAHTERTPVRSPEDIASLVMRDMSRLEQEEVRVILLDTRNHVISKHEVYRGSVHTTNIRIGELLRDAVKANAAGIVAVHNHPSGDPTPSAADISMTKSLFDAAKLMDIDLLDHLVIGGGKFVSLKSMGVGFPNGKQP
jgi:DNA repair protein RadC